MDFLITLHSHNRWLIVLFGLVAIIHLVLNLRNPKNYEKKTNLFVKIFSYVLAIQFVIGLILFYNKGVSLDWDMQVLRIQMEHATTMLLAVAIAHTSAAWKNAETSKRLRNTLFAMIVSILLIFAGVVRIGGFSLWLGM